MNKDIHSYYLQQLNIPQWQAKASVLKSLELDSQITDGAKLIFIYHGPNFLCDDFKLFLNEIGNALHFANREIGYIFIPTDLIEKFNDDELIKPISLNKAVIIIFNGQDLPKDIIKSQSKISSIPLYETFNWQSPQGKKISYAATDTKWLVHMKKSSFIAKGYSLMDILVSLGILSLLFVAGGGFYSHFIKRNVLDERINTMISAIKYSQNQAIITQKNLMLVPISHSSGWQKGMLLLYSDEKNKPLAEARILRKWQWHNDKYIHMSWHGVHEDGLLFANDVNSTMLSGSFILSQNQQVKSKIIINRIGRIRVENANAE